MGTLRLVCGLGPFHLQSAGFCQIPRYIFQMMQINAMQLNYDWFHISWRTRGVEDLRTDPLPVHWLESEKAAMRMARVSSYGAWTWGCGGAICPLETCRRRNSKHGDSWCFLCGMWSFSCQCNN